MESIANSFKSMIELMLDSLYEYMRRIREMVVKTLEDNVYTMSLIEGMNRVYTILPAELVIGLSKQNFAGNPIYIYFCAPRSYELLDPLKFLTEGGEFSINELLKLLLIFSKLKMTSDDILELDKRLRQDVTNKSYSTTCSFLLNKVLREIELNASERREIANITKLTLKILFDIFQQIYGGHLPPAKSIYQIIATMMAGKSLLEVITYRHLAEKHAVIPRAMVYEIVGGKIHAIGEIDVLMPSGEGMTIIEVTTRRWLKNKLKTLEKIRDTLEKRGIKTKVVYAPSIYSTAISLSGLQVYKFGKSCTIVYLEEHYKPVYPYIVLLENLARGLHTFFFLDFKKEENKAMKVSEAIEILLDFDKEYGVLSDPSLGIALARLGSTSEKIVVDSLENLRKENLGPPPHSLIIPGYLHPIEKDALVYIHKASNLVIDQWMKKLRKIDLESILKLLKE